MTRTYYDILQIQPEASLVEIQHAYRRLALRYHPDRNSGRAAESQMTAINEAYQALCNTRSPESVAAAGSMSKFDDGLTSSILAAARAVILRNGWTLSVEEKCSAEFETGNPRARILLTDRLTSESLCRIVRQQRALAAVLALHLERFMVVGPEITVIDLMHSERHGAAIPEGPCKSLLASFL